MLPSLIWETEGTFGQEITNYARLSELHPAPLNPLNKQCPGHPAIFSQHIVQALCRRDMKEKRQSL